MNRKMSTIVLALVAVVVVGLPTAHAATTKPQYGTPTGVSLLATGDWDLQIGWNPVPYADYYLIKIADNSSFNNAMYVKPIDYRHEPGDIEGMGSVSPPLKENTKYWFKVAVSNYKGDRLSSYSATRTGTTTCDPENSQGPCYEPPAS